MLDLKKYEKVNSGFRSKYVYCFGGDYQGFYSELNNMILAMAYCLKNGLRFELCVNDKAFLDGCWKNVFRPFCKENKGLFHRFFNRRYAIYHHVPDLTTTLINKVRTMGVFLYHLFKSDMVTSDCFDTYRTFWFYHSKFTVTDLFENASLQDVCHELTQMVYRFNDEWQSLIDKAVSSLNLPEHYAAVQIRRGDKAREKKLVSEEIVFNKMGGVINTNNVFVFTDDYGCIETLKRQFPQYNIFTLATPEDRGYNNEAFKHDTERQRAGCIKMFASMQVIARSDMFVGSMTTNPGMFLGMYMPKDKVAYVDADRWEIL